MLPQRAVAGGAFFGETWGVKTLRLLFLIALLALVAPLGARAEANWLTEYGKAQAEAKASHKLLLLDFTGSDWCIWCQKLHREVFTQPEFEKYAKENLVLMTVDFPRTKKLDPAAKKQNEELANKYHIEGFPTVIVLNADGKKVGELGYQPGGAEAFVKELQKLPRS